MRHYTFEYYNPWSALRLLGICMALFVGLLIISGAPIFHDYALIVVLLAIGAPVLLFLNQRGPAVKQGTAALSDDELWLTLDGEQDYMNLADVAYYKIEHYNGVKLMLHFREGRKSLKVAANNVYGDTKQFEQFCNEFERTVISFNRRAESPIARKTSFMANRYTQLFLILLTVAWIFLFVSGIRTGQGLKPAVIMNAALVASLWMAHYRAIQKEKRYRRALDEWG